MTLIRVGDIPEGAFNPLDQYMMQNGLSCIIAVEKI
jgi:hypothetical protein